MVGRVYVNRRSYCACRRATCESDETCESKMPRGHCNFDGSSRTLSADDGVRSVRAWANLPVTELGVTGLFRGRAGPDRFTIFGPLCRCVCEPCGSRSSGRPSTYRTLCTVIPTIRHIWKEEDFFLPSRRMDSQC